MNQKLEMENMFKEMIISMRPKQWYKNFVLFAGITFSLNFFNIQMLIIILLSFIIFCIVSGSVYITNDIMDKEKDKSHPVKCNRPITSGKLNPSYALIFMELMFSVALFGAYLINIQFLEITLAYFILTVLYSILLKCISIIDVLTISSGFVLRAIAGMGKNEFNEINFGFEVSKSPVIKWDQRIRKCTLTIKWLHSLLFHSPIFRAFIFASEAYQDKLWYPMIEKKNIENFKKINWEKLFESYKYGNYPAYMEVKEWDPY